MEGVERDSVLEELHNYRRTEREGVLFVLEELHNYLRGWRGRVLWLLSVLVFDLVTTAFVFKKLWPYVNLGVLFLLMLA